jgi:hypothetical protein
MVVFPLWKFKDAMKSHTFMWLALNNKALVCVTSVNKMKKLFIIYLQVFLIQELYGLIWK